MAYNITIKRFDGSKWQSVYPKTTIYQVENLSTTLANMQNDIDRAGASAVVNISSSVTLSSSHRNKFLVVNSSSSVNITVPTGSSAFSVGDEIHIFRRGSGSVTIVPPDDASLYSEQSKRKIASRYQAVTLKKIAAEAWVLIGALA